jgi:hypothetical protein
MAAVAPGELFHTATNAPVRVSEGFVTMPLHTTAMRWQEGNGEHNPGGLPFRWDSHKAGQVTFRILTLENRFLSVEIAPEAGGALAGVIHKPSGRDVFYREDAAKTRVPFWESGVKASFPYPEHGIRTLGQPAAWRVVTDTSGATTVAMWMEFSRFAGPDQRRMFGRYSPIALSQFVTLASDTARVDIRYRIANPCLYKLSRRLWNDAIFPRWEREALTARGINAPVFPDDARWIYPVAWASDHSGANLRRVTAEMLPLVDRGTSLFAWDRAFGFDGIYYPSSDVNRLRLSDPRETPGAKLWWPNMSRRAETNGLHHATGNIAEIWGGLDCVFEGVEYWLEPGETAEMTLSYALVSGIGEVRYADRSCAIGGKTDSTCETWSAVAFVPATSAVFRVADRETSGPCAPDRALSVSLPPGATNLTAVLALDGRSVTNAFPLAIPDGTTEHPRIALACSGPDTAERMGHALDRGMNWASALRGAPRPSVKRARLLCLEGMLDEAAEDLILTTERNPDDGEGWHMLGAIALEKGRPAEAAPHFARALESARPYAHARLGMALTALARDDMKTASAHLDALVESRPANFTARSLRAWIAVAARENGRGERLAALSREDSADPRVAWLCLLNDPGDRNQETIARLLQEPGAAARLTEFQAMTRGQYRHPPRAVMW